MYQVVNQKKKFKNVEFSEEIYGFPMASSKKVFTIGKYQVKNIIIISTSFNIKKGSKRIPKIGRYTNGITN